MLKTLPQHLLRHVDWGGHDTQWFTVILPVGYSYADIFNPHFWEHHKGLLSEYSMIRVRHEDGSFDVMLTVSSKAVNDDINVELWPKFPGHNATDAVSIAAAGADAANITPTLVPLSKLDGEPNARVEYLEATKWRVRGFNGEEVSRGWVTKVEAEKALARYLKQMNMTLPGEDAIAAAKEKIAKDIDAIKAEVDARGRTKARA